MEKYNPKHDPTHPLHIYKVHRILAHSYSMYFLLFLTGVILDGIFDVRIFSGQVPVWVGFGFLVLATLLIVWAQGTSRNLKIENLTKETFCRGPYCYTRSPTHWGLFFLMLGFGLVSNALFVVVLTVLAFIITRLTFLKKEEDALAHKYGSPYLEYKKSVKL
jgi:protein-S-isoprenylcysteine O-methyltransferase Ste14